MIDVESAFNERLGAIGELDQALRALDSAAEAVARDGSSTQQSFPDDVLRLCARVLTHVPWIPYVPAALRASLGEFTSTVRRRTTNRAEARALQRAAKEAMAVIRCHVEALRDARISARKSLEETSALRWFGLVRGPIGPLRVTRGGQVFPPIKIFEHPEDLTCELPPLCQIAGTALAGGAPEDLANHILLVPTGEDRAQLTSFAPCLGLCAVTLLESVDDGDSPLQRALWSLAASLLTQVVREHDPRVARDLRLGDRCEYVAEYAELPDEVESALREAALPFGPPASDAASRQALDLLERLPAICIVAKDRAARGGRRGRPPSKRSKWKRLGRMIEKGQRARTAAEWSAVAAAASPPLTFSKIHNELRHVVSSGEFKVARARIKGLLHFGTAEAIERRRQELAGVTGIGTA